MKIGLEGIKEAIAADMLRKLPRQRKTQRENLSEAIATILHIQIVNTSEIAAGLPRKAERMDMRYQWLLRLLDNPHIIPGEVMAPYAQEILVQLRDLGETIVLIMDQTHINKTFEMVMIGVRFNNRALPLGWIIKETPHQKNSLRSALSLFTKDLRYLLYAISRRLQIPTLWLTFGTDRC